MSFGGFHGGWPTKPSPKKPQVSVQQNRPQGPGQPKQNIPAPPLVNVQQNRPQGPGQGNVQAPRAEFLYPPPKPYSGSSFIRNSVAVVGRFKKWPWGQHPDEAYLADAMQACGVQVFKIDQDGPHDAAGEAEWVLFTSQPASYGKMERWKGARKTILWTLDWLPDYADRGNIIEAGRAADLFASSDQYDWAGKYGILNHFYLPAACESLYPPFNPKPHRTCAFLGTPYSDRRRRIAEIVKSLGGQVLDKQKQWVYGADLAKYVQATKVIVGDNVRNDIQGYWSSRNYVVTGAGGFLLTPHVPGIEADFTAGVHVVLYTSIDRLKEAIESCVEHDGKREAIRKAGFHHARVHHNWAVRARALLERIRVLSGSHR